MNEMQLPQEMQELEELAKPLCEYLRKNHNPHCAIIVEWDIVRVFEGLIGIPLKETTA